MKIDEQTCLICNCENSMPLDDDKLAKALGSDIGPIHTQLCRSQLAAFEAAIAGGKQVLVACTQEAALFQEVAEEHGKSEHVSFVNIRENAGWSNEAKNASAKIAGLLEAAAFESQPARLKSIHSDGMCLVYGSGQQAYDLAKILSEKLSVTLLLCDDDNIILPQISDIPIYRGDIVKAEGTFGNFTVTVDNYAPLMPSSRDGLNFVMARNGASSNCSLIFDLSGNAPLFAIPLHRDGYECVDPGDPAKLLRTTIQLSDMVGEFEKPIYVDYNAETCAHSRSHQSGCSNCLDACPAGAISDAGDIIAIDNAICGGCGSCYSVCPTGSISYSYPASSDIIAKAQILLSRYLEAGGARPVLFIHEEGFGGDLIAAMARFGRGLPANLIPFPMHAPTTISHVEMTAMMASGAEQIIFLTDPKKSDELTALESQCLLTSEIMSGFGFGEEARTQIISEADPDIVESQIWSLQPRDKIDPSSFSAFGSKRDIARITFSKLLEQSPNAPEMIILSNAAPYGRVDIQTENCTLCMSCASACPTSAITDTPGEPKLRFVESACVQCGICVNACPENALSLEPRLNLNNSALQPITLHEEEPFDCISCGTPFATKSTIERIKDQLANKHVMFADEERSKIIEMCEHCRVEFQANSTNDPFSGGPRPRVRTTEDYLEAEKKGLSPDDFIIN
ncbi:MAG: 4Fe-4S binding protein [Rhizobiaceae bacterium]|nr:4Fe-4S binding protein [Rhizobiaceae bacterium]